MTSSNRSFETLSEAFPNSVHQEMEVIAPPVPNQISQSISPATTSNSTTSMPLGLPSLAARNPWTESMHCDTDTPLDSGMEAQEDDNYRSTSTESSNIGPMNHMNGQMFLPSYDEYWYAPPSYLRSEALMPDTIPPGLRCNSQYYRPDPLRPEGMRTSPFNGGVMDLMPNMGDVRTGPDHVYQRANAFHEADREAVPDREESRLRTIRTSEENRNRVAILNKENVRQIQEMRKVEDSERVAALRDAQRLMGENASSSPTPTHDVSSATVDSTCNDECSYGSSDDSSCDDYSFAEEALKNLKESMDAMRAEATQHAKAQDLMWAIDNAHLKSFSYLSLNNGTVNDSKALVIDIFLSFRREEGHKIPTSVYCVPTSRRTRPEEDEKQFFLKLSNQIQALTGVTPRFEKEGEDHLVYYS